MASTTTRSVVRRLKPTRRTHPWRWNNEHDLSTETESETKPLKSAGDQQGGVDSDLPFGGRVSAARRTAGGSFCAYVTATALLAVVVLLVGYAYLEPADSMMRVHNALAYVGHVEAQNQMAQKYLQDAKSAESSSKAIDWLRVAAANGHAEAAYNLAVSHLKGHVVLTKGEARRLLHHAAKHDVDEAHFILTNVCHTSSDCD